MRIPINCFVHKCFPKLEQGFTAINEFVSLPLGLKLHLIILQHVEVPVPTPKKDEVLLKLEAASINPVDWKTVTTCLDQFCIKK